MTKTKEISKGKGFRQTQTIQRWDHPDLTEYVFLHHATTNNTHNSSTTTTTTTTVKISVSRLSPLHWTSAKLYSEYTDCMMISARKTWRFEFLSVVLPNPYFYSVINSVKTDSRVDKLWVLFCQDKFQSIPTLFSTLLRRDPEFRGLQIWGALIQFWSTLEGEYWWT